MGYMDFDKVRYYDAREVESLYYLPTPLKGKALPSDSTRRMDSVTLASGAVEDA